jgi:ribonucleotide monophosphatase NagD (HAD superfamily)
MAFRGFTTDVQMAKELGIKRNTISMVRTGRSRLGPLPRLRIYRDVYDEDTSELEEALESSDALLRMVRKYISMKNKDQRNQ